MARSLSTTVTEAYNDMRLDSFLYESGLYESRSKAVKQIEAGKVLWVDRLDEKDFGAYGRFHCLRGIRKQRPSIS